MKSFYRLRFYQTRGLNFPKKLHESNVIYEILLH